MLRLRASLIAGLCGLGCITPGSFALDAGATDAGQPSPDAGTTDAGVASTSCKRGLAYDLTSAADLAALSAGVCWWYDWGSTSHVTPTGGVDFVPMLWNGDFTASTLTTWLRAHPEVHYLLVLNEPNLTDQANLTPTAAAALWPRYEAIASDTGVKLVGPQITWGTMPSFNDPVVWMDAFYAAYRAANGNRDPHIDYLGFHWYDYGLGGQLDRLTKYGKPFWVTEMANWHSQNDGAAIDTLAKQKAQLTELVRTCEARVDVFRYAWFTGRMSNDVHFTSLLAANGQLTELGQLYVSLPR
jgi:Glycosyl hydrolase catalytic core